MQHAELYPFPLGIGSFEALAFKTDNSPMLLGADPNVARVSVLIY